MDDHTSKLPTQGSGVRSRPNTETSEVASQRMIEWEKLKLERQKYALEIRLKRRELREKGDKNLWKDLLANPVTIAIVGAVITLLTALVTSYFNASETRRAEAAKAVLAEQSAKETLQADLIKKFVEGPRTETVRENLRFLVDAGLIPSYAESIKKYLASNPGVAPQVGNGIEFLPSGVTITDDVKERLQKTVNQFRMYLQNLGFPGLDQNVSVFTYSKDNLPPDKAYLRDVKGATYADKTIYLHEKLAGDMYLTLIEYTQHALSVSSSSSGHPLYNEIESALSRYLPTSFSPSIGEVGLYSTASYEPSSELDKRGAVWGAALWGCRKRVGRQAVDSLILPAWQQAMQAGDDDRAAKEFGKALIAAAPPVGSCFSTELKNRKLPLL